MKNVAVIGAGLSGLSCAKSLQETANVTVFDKSRGVSGRMSTRYAGDFEFDHGAQYFTARHPAFKGAVLKAVSTGHVAPWNGRALYHKAGELEADRGADRFVATPRMNSWMKVWAAALNVRLGVRITKLTRSEGHWQMTDEAGEVYDGFDEVVLAIPSPQALNLLPDDFPALSSVKDAKMDACFALMLGFENLPDLGWDTLRMDTGPVAWLAVNSSKPSRGAAPTLMVHTAPDWSNVHADDDRAELMNMLLAETSRITGINAASAAHKSLHRWLYASNSSSPNIPCLRSAALNLTVCGDWCLGGRVENAFLSGCAAADAVKSSL